MHPDTYNKKSFLILMYQTFLDCSIKFLESFEIFVKLYLYVKKIICILKIIKSSICIALPLCYLNCSKAIITIIQNKIFQIRRTRITLHFTISVSITTNVDIKRNSYTHIKANYCICSSKKK